MLKMVSSKSVSFVLSHLLPSRGVIPPHLNNSIDKLVMKTLLYADDPPLLLLVFLFSLMLLVAVVECVLFLQNVEWGGWCFCSSAADLRNRTGVKECDNGFQKVPNKIYFSTISTVTRLTLF
jgi:hypothetical protein